DGTVLLVQHPPRRPFHPAAVHIVVSYTPRTRRRGDRGNPAEPGGRVGFDRCQCRQPQVPSSSAEQSCCFTGAGTSNTGERSKNPSARSVKPATSVGMIGQSSTRGKCVRPKVCQTTLRWVSTSRSARTHSPIPPWPGFWLA